MTDPLADKARADWTELVAVVGAECELEVGTWCPLHHAKGKAGRCAVGRVLDDMAATLSMLLLEREP